MSRLGRLWRRNSATRSAAVVFLGTGFANLMLLVATAIAARALGPSDFGAIGAMLALIIIIGVLPFALSVLIARDVAAAASPEAAVLVTRPRLVNRIALTVSATGVVLSPVLAGALEVPTALVAVTMVSAYPQVLLAVPRGLMQGRRQFGAFAANLVWEGASRLLAVGAALALGGGVVAVGAAPLVAMTSSLVLGLWQAGLLASVDRLINERHRGWGNELIGAVLLYGGVFAMTNIDVVIAKARFPGSAAGEYAVAAMFGKIVFFLPVAIGSVMVPAVSRARTAGHRTSGILWRAVIAVGGLSLAATLAAVIAPGPIRDVLGGAAYAGADQIMALYGVAMTMLSLASLLGSYLVAMGMTRVGWLFMSAAATEIILLLMLPTQPTDFVATLAVLATMTAAVLMLLAVRADRRFPGINQAT